MKRIKRKKREGAVLLIVLFVVMAITVLSLGFISRSDVELACGKNMILRTQMVHLAESGLEHARGLILSPQDVDTEYWQGDVRQQLVAGGNDYYDVLRLMAMCIVMAY
jgi:type II secretory pathway component PulK